MESFLEFSFPKSLGYDVKLHQDWDTHKLRKRQRGDNLFSKYYKIDFRNRKHTVIAVQGTNDAYDALAGGVVCLG